MAFAQNTGVGFSGIGVLKKARNFFIPFLTYLKISTGRTNHFFLEKRGKDNEILAGGGGGGGYFSALTFIHREACTWLLLIA
jgi:hypothetical protein